MLGVSGSAVGYDGPSYSVKYLGKLRLSKMTKYYRYCRWNDGHSFKKDGYARTDSCKSNSLQGGFKP